MLLQFFPLSDTWHAIIGFRVWVSGIGRGLPTREKKRKRVGINNDP